MADLELIDFHTHTFPTPERGVAWLSSIGHRDPERTGTIDELLGMMQRANISHAVMLSYTPTRYMYEARIRQQTPAEIFWVRSECCTVGCRMSAAQPVWQASAVAAGRSQAALYSPSYPQTQASSSRVRMRGNAQPHVCLASSAPGGENSPSWTGVGTLPAEHSRSLWRLRRLGG